MPASSASPVSERLAAVAPFPRFFAAGFDEQPVAVTPSGTSIAATTATTSRGRQGREPAAGARRGPGQGPPAARIFVDSFPEPLMQDALRRRLGSDRIAPAGITR